MTLSPVMDLRPENEAIRVYVHDALTYHLPSWQGGSQVLPRCKLTPGGPTTKPGARYVLADSAALVTCPACIVKRMAAVWA